jgi:hypothetical protein
VRLCSKIGLIFNSNPSPNVRFEPEPSGGAGGPGFSCIVELAFLNRSASSFLSSAFSLPRYECLKFGTPDFGVRISVPDEPNNWAQKT